MLTMLLGGLWHGAGWNFLIWGGLHGLYLVANHLWRGAKVTSAATPSGRVACWALTFVAVVVAWVFFRARTLIGARQMLIGLLGLEGGGATYVSPGVIRVMDLPLLVGEPHLLLIGAASIAAALAVALFLPNVPRLFRYREYRRAPEPATPLDWQPNFMWAAVTALALAVSLFGMWQRIEFLYFQF
jgi:hypothetical protein